MAQGIVRVTSSSMELMEAEFLCRVWEDFLEELILSWVLKGRLDVGTMNSQAVTKCLPN